MAAAALRDKQPSEWDELLLRLEETGLTSLAHHVADYAYGSVGAALQVSLDQLDDHDREQSVSLAIFPSGIAYYIAAPLDEETKRYTELKQRLTEHLPTTDDVRKKTVKAIDTGLKDFETATKALDAARTADSLAATRLASG